MMAMGAWGVIPPWQHNQIEQTAFNAYAYHQQKIEDFINLLAAEPDPNDADIQWALCYKVGLNPDNLSPYDLDYIEREVAKRL